MQKNKKDFLILCCYLLAITLFIVNGDLAVLIALITYLDSRFLQK